MVVGFDRYINYYKIQMATLCIRENPGCLFIATNTDAVTHLTDAQEWAGNGSMVGAIKGEHWAQGPDVGAAQPLVLLWLCPLVSSGGAHMADDLLWVLLRRLHKAGTHCGGQALRVHAGQHRRWADL